MIARLDSRRQAAQVRYCCDVRSEPFVYRDTLIEYQIGPRERHDRGPLGRDRRSRDHRVTGPTNQAVENIVEIVALIGDGVQFQP